MLTGANIKMSFDHAIINIKNLRLRTFIGFNDEEKSKQQDVVINMEIKYIISEAALNDQVEHALNYKTITKAVINYVEQGRFLLLEKLVAGIIKIASDHPDVLYAKITVDKPHALRFADSVSLTLEHHAKVHEHLNYLEKAS
jgi:D-erythro-7,8-dihydroneopterin triphosphate epimerase